MTTFLDQYSLTSQHFHPHAFPYRDTLKHPLKFACSFSPTLFTNWFSPTHFHLPGGWKLQSYSVQQKLCDFHWWVKKPISPTKCVKAQRVFLLMQSVLNVEFSMSNARYKPVVWCRSQGHISPGKRSRFSELYYENLVSEFRCTVFIPWDCRMDWKIPSPPLQSLVNQYFLQTFERLFSKKKPERRSL